MNSTRNAAHVFTSRIGWVGTMLTFVFGSSIAMADSRLDPADFASLGSVHLQAGSYYLDADTLELRRDDGSGPVLSGVVVKGMAVWAFDTLHLDSGASVVGIGSRPIALLSRGDISIDGHLAMTPGANGGWSMNQGPGAGQTATGSSGGGGFGGRGGHGGPLVAQDSGLPLSGGAGGSAYGSLIDVLVGGSGGGGWSDGGSGGGALQLGGLGLLSIQGLVTANGGWGEITGGGGSGGGILLHAQTVQLASSHVAVQAIGGEGAPLHDLYRTGIYEGGGGGGGGRVEIYTTGFLGSLQAIDVSGGSGWENGERGVVLVADPDLIISSVPEPATIVLLAAALPPLLAGVVLFQRRRGLPRE